MIHKTEIEAGNLSLPGATSVGVRAGAFLFFGVQTPMNLETGMLVSDFPRDLPEEASRQLTTGMLSLDSSPYPDLCELKIELVAVARE